jgi:A/G-specific adenine glycosylase
LKKIADKVVSEYKGTWPHEPEVLETFPGIGPATARSICAFAFNLPVVFIETNIRLVYIHHFFGDQLKVESGKLKVGDTELLPLIEKTLDRKNPREWYWALMDYGSYLVKQVENPNRQSKHYSKQSKFEGSRRQVRGEILKLLKFQTSVTLQQVEKLFPERQEEIEVVFNQLAKEGFIVVRRGRAVLQ